MIFHCVYLPQLPYPFICQWTSRLLPCPGYCKWCCNKHCGTCIFSFILLKQIFLFIYLFDYAGSWGFPGGSDGKESSYNAGDLCLIPGLGSSPGEGDGNPLQYSFLENSMDGRTWWAIVMGLQRVGHNGILLSYKKEFIWVSSNEVDEPGAYYTEWSKAETESQILCINTYIWNLERW